MDATKLKTIHDDVISVMTFVEKLVPDGTPGLAKLDVALKIILKLDSSLQGEVPTLKKLFTLAKQTYNEVRATFKDAAQSAGA